MEQNTQGSPFGEDNKSYYVWIIAIVIIILLGFFGYKMYTKNSTPTDGDDSGYGQNGGVNDGTSKPTGDIEVSNQIPGNTVYLTSVTLSHPGFVAVSITKGSSAGKVIGSKAFSKGTNPGQVSVSEKTVEGEIYTASLYADDGDGVFNATKDMFIVEKTFRATKYLDYIKG